MFKYSKRVPKDGSDAVGEILKAAADPKIISFAGGLPAPELFPVAEMKKATDDVYDENGKEALQYGSAKGVLKLRKTIAKRMLDREGIKTDPDHIMVSTGSEQVIDLVGKAFIDSGDTVFVEQPTYLCAIDVFKSYGAKFVSVPMDDDGMRTDALEEALKEHPEVKLLYTVPNFQNPTGRTMPADRREALAKLAEKYDFMVLEDNPYGDIRFAGEHVPSVKSFDKSGHVIYMSTFSKILAPGLRLGWAIADLDVINKLTVLKQSADLHSDNLAQYIVAKFFEENDIEKHIKKISQLYGSRKKLMTDNIKKYFPKNVKFSDPEGGMFLWVQVPGVKDTTKLFNMCIKHNVAFVPGVPFFAGAEIPGSFRLNYSNMKEDQIEVGIKRLASAIKEVLSEQTVAVNK